MYSLEYGNVLQVERPIVIKIVWLRQQQNTGRCQNKFVGRCRYSSGVKCSVSFYPSRECANDDKYITRKWTNALTNVGTLVEVVKEWGWVGNYSGRSFCQSGQFLMKYFTCWRMESRFIFYCKSRRTEVLTTECPTLLLWWELITTRGYSATVNFSITDAEIFILGATLEGVSSMLFSHSRLIESSTIFSEPTIRLIE